MERAGLLVAASLFVMVGAACVHDYRKDPEVIAGVRKATRWVTMDLRPCAAQAAGTNVDALTEADYGTKVTVQGILELRGARICTEMSCSSACCNGCIIPWVLTPLHPRTSGAPGNADVTLHLSPEFQLSVEAMDCKVSAVRDLAPKRPVMVNGTYDHFQRRLMIDRPTMCALPKAPPPSPPRAHRHHDDVGPSVSATKFP